VKISLWRAVPAAVAGIGCLGALCAGTALAETLSIRGSAGFANEVMTPYRDRIETLTGHKLNLTVDTAGGGLLALLKGETDLAMVSAPLASIVAPLRKARPDLPFGLLQEFRISEARVAFPVNPNNPVRSVSLAKLKQILNGQIDNWRALGGPDLAIHVISLRDGRGTKHTTEAFLLDGQSITASATKVRSSEEVAQIVKQERGALGICRTNVVTLHHLPELHTKIQIAQSYNLVSLNEPTDAMRAVIAATRSVVFEEEP
jgi:phosphate transport system substrate-binding protein